MWMITQLQQCKEICAEKCTVIAATKYGEHAKEASHKKSSLDSTG